MRQDIKGYEGLYQINKKQEVKSLDRIEECKNVLTGGTHRKRKGRILKPHPDTDGYLLVVLRKDNKPKNHSIHRLMAETYLPNPDNLPEVNHEDGNKKNNDLSNLKWCTRSYNIQHSFDNKLNVYYDLGKHHRAIPVKQFSLEGELIKEWECMKSASIELGIPRWRIGRCCQGIYKQVGGYKWQYATPK